MATRFNIAYIYQAIDKFTPIADKINKSIKAHEARLASLSDVGKRMQSVGAKMTAAISLPIVGMLAWSVKSAAGFESLREQFNVMLGDVKRGSDMVNKIRDFAAKTPFQLKGLGDAAKVMLAFGISQEKIIPNLQMLGDVAGGNQQKLDSLTLAFSQIQSTGRLMGQDLLQLINAGFNPLQIISEKTGVSMAVLKDSMSEGAISAEMVSRAFEIATSKGGRFYKNMIRQSKTFNGVMSTLWDNLNIIAATIGDTIIPALKKLITSFNNMTENIVDFVNNNPKLVKMGVIFLGIVAAIGPLLVAFGTLLTMLPILTIGMAIFWAAVTSPITLVIAAIIALAALGTFLYHKFKPFQILINIIFDSIVKRVKAVILIFNTVIFIVKELYTAFTQIEEIIKSVGMAIKGMPMPFKLGFMTPEKLAGVEAPPPKGVTTSFVESIVRIVAPKGTVEKVETKGRGSPNIKAGVNFEKEIPVGAL